MNKILKSLLSTFLLVIIVLTNCNFVSASQNSKGVLGENVIWEFDRATGVLTFSSDSVKSSDEVSEGSYYRIGNVEMSYDNFNEIIKVDFYEKIVKKYKLNVKKIVVKESGLLWCAWNKVTGEWYLSEPYENILNSEIFPNLQYYVMEIGKGYSTEYNINKEILTLKGKGEWPYGSEDIYMHGWKNPSIKIDDGLTKVGKIIAATIFIGKDLKDFEELDADKYVLDTENPYFTLYNEVLHSKDCTTVYAIPSTVTKWNFHPNVHTIDLRAIPYYYDLSEPIVIPWGITTFAGDGYSYGKGSSADVVYPDTLMHFPEDIKFSESGYEYISGNNKALVENYIGLPCIHRGIDKKKYYSYYDIKPNSLKTFQNGKTYYFDSNYKMAKGWKKVNSTWYYFNDYGAAVVKIWLKSGGKWYYMQQDGTMATNKWIKWYNKWYYVGADGAMYTNCKTPDGYWVNANGVWVQ